MAPYRYAPPFLLKVVDRADDNFSFSPRAGWAPFVRGSIRYVGLLERYLVNSAHLTSWDSCCRWKTLLRVQYFVKICRMSMSMREFRAFSEIIIAQGTSPMAWSVGLMFCVHLEFHISMHNWLTP